MALTNSGNLIVRQLEAVIELGHEKAQAARELAAEKRMNTQAIDELRMETRAALKAAGVSVGDIQEHHVEKSK